ncbi:hypothetical protein ACFWFU_07040 [Streptomyces sp. NPDC060235]|uniref:hypothetical protein n=1 Tax=Streptomyces sp. NPDC060235 TaxID=3347080 RepID=UPI0036544C09
MNRPVTNLLCIADAVASLILVYCAVISHQHGSTTYTVILGTLAVLFALALAHTSYLADELHTALRRLEAAARPARLLSPNPTTDGIVAAAMARWCCDTAVQTAGLEHDPDHCTRKDQTT